MGNIKFEDWGLANYRDSWDRQRQLFNGLIEDPEKEEVVVLVEHPHTYTLGFHGNEANMIASEQRLKSLGAECIRIERGGDITYHGPGQLVVYPIINLHRHHLGVKSYIQLLEHAILKVLESYNINNASSNDNAIGVWLDWNEETARKICAIGVKISHGITMHGLALNVNTDLSGFSLINPCGFVDKGVTSIQKEIGHEVDMNEVKSRFISVFECLLMDRDKTE